MSLKEWPLPSALTRRLPATRVRSSGKLAGRCVRATEKVRLPAQLVRISAASAVGGPALASPDGTLYGRTARRRAAPRGAFGGAWSHRGGARPVGHGDCDKSH